MHSIIPATLLHYLLAAKLHIYLRKWCPAGKRERFTAGLSRIGGKKSPLLDSRLCRLLFISTFDPSK
jgi:hypothetical protein